jgi:hypothetical protein
MSEYHRDEEKTGRLGDPLPRLEPCSCCRGYAKVEGGRCPECDGGATREAQQVYMAKLVGAAAVEKSPRIEGTAVTIESLFEQMGANVVELFRLPLRAGDVLVWCAHDDHPDEMAAKFCRNLR